MKEAFYSIFAGLLLAGAGGYLLIVLVSIWRFLRRKRHLKEVLPDGAPAFTILKPLCGLEENLQENLQSFFQLDYPNYEILIGVHDPSDPALQVAEQLRQRYPTVPCRVFVTGQPAWPNAKVHQLAYLMKHCSSDLVLASDSDVRIPADSLQWFLREFASGADILSCPYRAVAGPSFWSYLESLSANTDFMDGILAAELLEGMKFTVGVTVAFRRSVLEDLGGFEAFSQYVAEDFVIGQKAARRGYRVALSNVVVEHWIGHGATGFCENLAHRLRWNRTTRVSRKWGYGGQFFTYPIPLSLLACTVSSGLWGWGLTVMALRYLVAIATMRWVLQMNVTWKDLLWLPVADCLAFLLWLAGFFGNRVIWRGRSYRIQPDGRFVLIGEAPAEPQP